MRRLHADRYDPGRAAPTRSAAPPLTLFRTA